MKIIANSIEIDAEMQVPEGGDPAAPVVLLIMGLGMQRTAWPQDHVVQPLLAAGFRVITFDNRDIGLSQGFEAAGTPNLLWATVKRKIGLPLNPPYTLADMAHDAAAVLDAFKVSRAHVVGASMGGMIAQHMAARFSACVASVTSIMSSSGAPGLPGPQAQVLKAMLQAPKSRERPDVLAHYIKLWRLIGSPAYAQSDEILAARISAGLDRSYRPAGTARQLLAVAADHKRHSEVLPAITQPTLVVHGLADPLVPLACGQDTAKRIKGAQFVGVEGMGHDLAPGACVTFMPKLVSFVRTAEQQRRKRVGG